MIQHLLFDFDGVLLDSAQIKADGYLSVLDVKSPERRAEIQAYVEVHGGVSRFEKFRHIYHSILGAPLSDETHGQLCDSYANLIFEKVLAAPEISGVTAFLRAQSRERQCYVVSGAPQTEIMELVQARSWSPFFVECLGSPTPKDQLVVELVERQNIRHEEALFFGDSITDFTAANKANIRFIGIGSPWPDSGQIWFRDFTTPSLKELLK